jgi:hypothetical protein
VGQVGRQATCVPIANRHARRLAIAAQDGILPHSNPPWGIASPFWVPINR